MSHTNDSAMNINKLTKLFLILTAGIAIFSLGIKVGQSQIFKKNSSAKNYRIINQGRGADETIDFSLFWQAWDKLGEKYFDKKKLDKKKMFYGAIKGMVSAIDDQHTFFLTPEENKGYKEDLDGVFSGIGAQLGLKNRQIIVIAPLKHSPAEKAGLLAGDVITKVDGLSTEKWSLIEAVTKIRGPKGSSVKISFLRSEKEREVEIKRAEIKVSPVELTYEKRVAILKLAKFGDDTIKDWDRAVAEIKSKWDGKQIDGMILDMRDNPGGYLQGAVYVANEFIPRGSLVVKQKGETVSEEYKATRQPKLPNIPLVILVNKGSASASEIVAGAVADYGRAKLVGQVTFGKGTIQEAMELKDEAGLHVTIAAWLLPKGESIEGKGVTPTIKIENKIEDGNTLTRANDKQLDRAIEEVIK